MGALVGWCARSAGGRGKALGAACCVLVIASILGGKYISIRIRLGEVIREREASYDRGLYDRISKVAGELAAGAGQDRHAQMLVDLGWTPSSIPGTVSREELKVLRETAIPNLMAWGRMPPRFEAWQEGGRAASRDEVLAGVQWGRAMTSTLSGWDILFAILGIGAALRFAGPEKKPARAADPGLEGSREPRMRARGEKITFPKKRGMAAEPPFPPPEAPPVSPAPPPGSPPESAPASAPANDPSPAGGPALPGGPGPDPPPHS